jgi:hypothetical protein
LSWLNVVLNIGASPTKFGLLVAVLGAVLADLLVFFAAIVPVLVTLLRICEKKIWA